MKINKEVLLELLWVRNGELVEGIERVLVEYNGSSRWSSHHTLIVKVDGIYYATSFKDESPWEYDGDEIECYEVKPVEKTIIEYVKV